VTGVAIGMVGAGAVATRHVQTLLGMGGVRVVAVADPAIERARRLADLAARRRHVIQAVFACPATDTGG